MGGQVVDLGVSTEDILMVVVAAVDSLIAAGTSAVGDSDSNSNSDSDDNDDDDQRQQRQQPPLSSAAHEHLARLPFGMYIK